MARIADYFRRLYPQIPERHLPTVPTPDSRLRKEWKDFQEDQTKIIRVIEAIIKATGKRTRARLIGMLAIGASAVAVIPALHGITNFVGLFGAHENDPPIERPRAIASVSHGAIDCAQHLGSVTTVPEPASVTVGLEDRSTVDVMSTTGGDLVVNPAGIPVIPVFGGTVVDTVPQQGQAHEVAGQFTVVSGAGELVVTCHVNQIPAASTAAVSTLH